MDYYDLSDELYLAHKEGDLAPREEYEMDEWAEPHYCGACGLEFVKESGEDRCPRCGGFDLRYL